MYWETQSCLPKVSLFCLSKESLDVLISCIAVGAPQDLGQGQPGPGTGGLHPPGIETALLELLDCVSELCCNRVDLVQWEAFLNRLNTAADAFERCFPMLMVNMPEILGSLQQLLANHANRKEK